MSCARHREMKAAAVALRQQGRSLRAIASSLGISVSTASSWLRDVRLTGEQRRRLLRRDGPGSAEARRRGAARRRERAEEEARRASVTAQAALGSLTDRDLMIAGAVLYWAEGAKAKPWRPARRVRLSNSDAGLVRLFLAWLDLIGVGENDRTFQVQIHESADLDAARRYWLGVTGASPSRFRPPTLKRHRPATIRKNVGDSYHGCLSIYVSRGASLYRTIEAWMGAIVGSADARRARGGLPRAGAVDYD